MHRVTPLKVLYFRHARRAGQLPQRGRHALDAARRVGDPTTAFQVAVLRTHVAEELLIPGTDYWTRWPGTRS